MNYGIDDHFVRTERKHYGRRVYCDGRFVGIVDHVSPGRWVPRVGYEKAGQGVFPRMCDAIAALIWVTDRADGEA